MRFKNSLRTTQLPALRRSSGHRSYLSLGLGQRIFNRKHEFVCGRVMIRGATPTLRGCKVRFSSPRTFPLKSSAKSASKKAGHSHNVRQRVATQMVDVGRHGAPFRAPLHKTVTQHIGWLIYLAPPGVRHHGGRGSTAADIVSSCVVHKVPKILTPGTNLRYPRSCTYSYIQKVLCRRDFWISGEQRRVTKKVLYHV